MKSPRNIQILRSFIRDLPVTYWRVHSSSLGANKKIFRRGLWNIANSTHLADLDPMLLNHLRAQALRTEGAEQMTDNPLAAIGLIFASLMLSFSVKTAKALVYSLVNLITPKVHRQRMLAKFRA